MARGKRPVTICKLCLQLRILEHSHLMGASFYAMMRDPGAANPNPILIMRDITIQSSRQVQDFVLCRDCEQRFSRNGEEYMAGLVYNGATFPLQDRLNLALPVSAYRIGNAQAFSGPDAGIDTGKMAYFALSIIWRSAVHKWHISSRATTTLSLGAHEEQIRKYLLGEASFPPDVAVMATVCTDLPSREGFYVPGAVRNSAVPAYAVMVKGIYFRAFMASNLPPDIRRNCCVTSPRCPIFLRNCEREALETWGNLCATSRPVGALAGTN